MLFRCVVILSLTCGCVMPDDLEIDINALSQAQITFNGWQFEAAKFNALVTNPGALTALSTLPLEELLTTPYVDAQLEDPFAQVWMEYVAGCALDLGQSLSWTSDSGDAMTFPGELGLCSTWHDTAPSPACLQVVSACVLARNNHLGVQVPLSLRGIAADGAPIDTSNIELLRYVVPEAAFYGTMFDAGALNPRLHVFMSGDDVMYVHDRKVSLLVTLTGTPADRLRSRQTAHDAFMASHEYSGVVFNAMNTCSAPGWTAAEAYASDRLCASPGGFEHCAARWVGYCREPESDPSTAAAWLCATADQTLVAGDGDFDDCQDPMAHVWSHPLTSYLHL